VWPHCLVNSDYLTPDRSQKQVLVRIVPRTTILPACATPTAMATPPSTNPGAEKQIIWLFLDTENNRSRVYPVLVSDHDWQNMTAARFIAGPLSTEFKTWFPGHPISDLICWIVNIPLLLPVLRSKLSISASRPPVGTRRPRMGYRKPKGLQYLKKSNSEQPCTYRDQPFPRWWATLE
jgi:hypothetical protein